MFAQFARWLSPPQTAHSLYIALVEQSRQPVFYTYLGVPDSLDGRFELILIHLFLFLRRMTPEQMWDSFTTLIHTAPDLPNVPLREATDTFLANARKLGEALEHLTPTELLQRADITSEVFRKNAAQFKVLQQGIAEAQKRAREWLSVKHH